MSLILAPAYVRGLVIAYYMVINSIDWFWFVLVGIGWE